MCKIDFRWKMTSAAVLLAVASLAGHANAQGFDTSTIQADEALSARVPAHIRKAGVLVGGSDNNYAPWEYLAGDDGQTPEGIDIDIGKGLAAKLGLTYESRTAQFTTILPALGTNFDIGLNAFSITPERMEVVNFVSYAETGNLWVIQAGNPKGFDSTDVCGRAIAVNSGTSHEEGLLQVNQQCLDAGKPEMSFLPFATQTEAVTRVASGGADATMTGSATALYAAFMSQDRLETLSPTGKTLDFRGLNGIPVAKADMELTQLIADTLNALIADGTYNAILAAWGMRDVGVKEALINPGQ